MLVLARAFAISLVFVLISPPLGAAQMRVVEVISSSVTLRECLPDPSAPDDPSLDTVIITGLRPGENRALTPAEVSLRLSQAGVDPSSIRLPTAPIVVARRSQTVSSEALVAAGEGAIRAQLGLQAADTAVIFPLLPPRPLLAPLGDLALSTLVKLPALPGGLWVVTVSIGDLSPSECTIRYRVRVFSDVLVAREPLKSRQIVASSSVETRRVEVSGLRGEVLRTIDELVGRRAARAVSAGTVVTTEWLEAVPAVARGEQLTVVSRVGSVVARLRVTALSDGAIGEVVAARVGRETDPMWVRITGQGCAETAPSPKER